MSFVTAVNRRLRLSEGDADADDDLKHVVSYDI